MKHCENCKGYNKCWSDYKPLANWADYCDLFEEKSLTNFDRIKAKIAKMNMRELFEYFGGETCENIICGEIPKDKAHCAESKPHNCAKCVLEYLESEVQGE